jgi:hypothetical protein
MHLYVALLIILFVIIGVALILIKTGLEIRQPCYELDPTLNERFTYTIESFIHSILYNNQLRWSTLTLFMCLVLLFNLIQSTRFEATERIIAAKNIEQQEEYLLYNEDNESNEETTIKASEEPTPLIVEAKDDSEELEDTEVEESAWQEIPLCDTKYSTKTYMDDEKITSRTSEQWKLFNESKWGDVITDDIGFQYILGTDPDTGEEMKFYTVALGTYYMDHIGQKFRITLESGFTFGAIIGDQKSDAHTHAGSESASLLETMTDEEISAHNPNKCLAGSNDALEFIIDSDVLYSYFPGKNGYANSGSMNYDFDDEHMFSGKIVKIEVLTDS